MHQTALDLIIYRFADVQKEQIERLYLEDAIFREICQDYAECVRMRDRYADDPTELEAPRYEHDYEILIEALEEEVHAILIKSQSDSSNSVRAYETRAIEHPPSSHLRFIDKEDENV